MCGETSLCGRIVTRRAKDADEEEDTGPDEE